MPDGAPFGLRALGAASSRREVVSFERATRLYATADSGVHVAIPAFLSAFRYPQAICSHTRTTGSTAGYSGPIGIDAINFDIDRPILDEAIRDARRLTAFLTARWQLDDGEILVAFSGSKGFHVSIRTAGISPAPDNHRVARCLASEVAGLAGVAIDVGVYLPTQLWRAWNTRHPKTGLHKVRIDADDLLHLSADAVKRLAANPLPFDLPSHVVHPAILSEWSIIANRVRVDDERKLGERRSASVGSSKINPLTWAFIHEGATEGERHRLLFSAAANLAEFGDLDELIKAILTRPGLDTGLPEREVARQIECGIKYARTSISGENP